MRPFRDRVAGHGDRHRDFYQLSGLDNGRINSRGIVAESLIKHRQGSLIESSDLNGIVQFYGPQTPPAIAAHGAKWRRILSAVGEIGDYLIAPSEGASHFGLGRWNTARAHGVDIDGEPAPTAYVFARSGDSSEFFQPVPGPGEDIRDEFIDSEVDGRPTIPRGNGPEQISIVVKVPRDEIGRAHV